MRSPRYLFFLAASIGLVVTACGGAGPSAPQAQVGAARVALVEQSAAPGKSEAAKPALPPMQPKLVPPGPALAPLSYDAKGRRDPFVPLIVAREKAGLEVSSVKLVGIIDGSHLLALVEAPDGLGYIVKPGDVLGNGQVTDVAPSSITFAVRGRPGQADNSLTLRLSKD